MKLLAIMIFFSAVQICNAKLVLTIPKASLLRGEVNNLRMERKTVYIDSSDAQKSCMLKFSSEEATMAFFSILKKSLQDSSFTSVTCTGAESVWGKNKLFKAQEYDINYNLKNY